MASILHFSTNKIPYSVYASDKYLKKIKYNIVSVTNLTVHLLHYQITFEANFEHFWYFSENLA